MTQQLPDERPAIAAAIIVDQGRVLLVRRRQKEGSLLWAFPSGGVEPGETAQEAAAREVKEEVGLDVTAGRTLGERVHPATSRRMIYVACEVTGGEARVLDEEELAELTWSEHAQLSEYIPHGFLPAVQEHLDSTLGIRASGPAAADESDLSPCSAVQKTTQA